MGYEFGGGFRVEGEVFFARAEVDTVTYKGVTTALGPLPITVKIPVSGTADQLGAFASAWYDFRTGTDWIPYVGGGFGFIRIDQSDLEYDSQKLFRDTVARLKASGRTGTENLPGSGERARRAGYLHHGHRVCLPFRHRDGLSADRQRHPPGGLSDAGRQRPGVRGRERLRHPSRWIPACGSTSLKSASATGSSRLLKTSPARFVVS